MVAIVAIINNKCARRDYTLQGLYGRALSVSAHYQLLIFSMNLHLFYCVLIDIYVIVIHMTVTSALSSKFLLSLLLQSQLILLF